MNLKSKILPITAATVFLALPAVADTVNVYQIGSTHPGTCGANTALDPFNVCITGTATPTWSNNFSGNLGDTAFLSILAEGIDNGSVIPGGEVDQVIVNGTPVGDLSQQSFYSPFFNLSNSNAITGPGDIDGDNSDPTVANSGVPNNIITDLTLSVFNVTGLVGNGANSIQVVVDPGNFVDEIDVSTLAGSPVPEPSTLFVLVLASGLLCISSRRKRLS
jgi:hypothetical protein